jgi:hypothetical protein
MVSNNSLCPEGPRVPASFASDVSDPVSVNAVSVLTPFSVNAFSPFDFSFTNLDLHLPHRTPYSPSETTKLVGLR